MTNCLTPIRFPPAAGSFWRWFPTRPRARIPAGSCSAWGRRRKHADEARTTDAVEHRAPGALDPAVGAHLEVCGYANYTAGRRPQVAAVEHRGHDLRRGCGRLA